MLAPLTDLVGSVVRPRSKLKGHRKLLGIGIKLTNKYLT